MRSGGLAGKVVSWRSGGRSLRGSVIWHPHPSTGQSERSTALMELLGRYSPGQVRFRAGMRLPAVVVEVQRTSKSGAPLAPWLFAPRVHKIITV